MEKLTVIEYVRGATIETAEERTAFPVLKKISWSFKTRIKLGISKAAHKEYSQGIALLFFQVGILIAM